MNRPREPKTLARVREIFGSRGFRGLFATRVISQFGDGIFQLATADLLLFDKPGHNPAFKLAAIAAITLLPFSIIAPFVGVFIDRWERRKILAYTPMARAFFAALIGLGIGKHKQGVGFYLIVLVVLSANRLFLATISATLPQTVPSDDLLVANSVASTGGSLAGVIGLGVGSILSAVIGGTSAAGIAAVAFVLGGLIAARVPISRGADRLHKVGMQKELRVILRGMQDGVRRMSGNPRVRFAMISVGLNQVLVGGMIVGTAVYFIRDLRLGIGAVSASLAALAAGIGIGIAVVPWVGARMRHDALIPLAFAIAGIDVVLTGATLSRLTIIIGSAFVGLAYAMTKIPVDTIVQEELPDSHRGRGFAAYDMLFNVARLAGTAATAGVIGLGSSPRALVFTIGGIYLAGSAGLLLAERRLHPGEPVGPISEPISEPLARQSTMRSKQAPLAEFLVAGELVTVRTHSGHRADSKPRTVIIGDREFPVENVVWQAMTETLTGERRRVFVVRLAGRQVRLSVDEDSSRWEIDSVFPFAGP